MRGRLLTRCGLATVALAGGLVLTPAAAASRPSPTAAASAWSHSQTDFTRTCYAQPDHDMFNGVISQNWEPAFDAYDSQAADDFVLNKACRRPLLDIDGSYGEGTGTADSFNVTIYRAGKHGPGGVVRYLAAIAYTDTCHDLGCVQIRLGKKLKAGHWWISVQANLSWSETGSMWSWWTNATVRQAGAVWRNPADGFQTGCTTYTDLITCMDEGSSVGGDLSFTLSTAPRG
jgi:hypothetical protein